MTPQMQQSIKLLQTNSLELEQMVDQEILENPLLEIDDEIDDEAAPPEHEAEASEDLETQPNPADQNGSSAENQGEAPPDISDAGEAKQENTDDDASLDEVDVNWEEMFDFAENKVYTPPAPDTEVHDFTTYTAARTGLSDFLLRQLRLSALEGADLEIGEFLIGSLDEDGYLTDTVERIAEDLEAGVEDVERILKILQTFDPPGVFARDVPECLLLQLEDQGRKTPLVETVLKEHFDLFQKKRFRDIARAVGAEENQVQDLLKVIRHLEPKPGRIRSKEEVRYITPDVYVTEIDGEYIYTLNEGPMTGLPISKFYRDLLRDQQAALDGAAVEYAKEKFRAAVMLLKNIEKRKSTILRVTEAIMQHQEGFLNNGVSQLRPLTLREIAEVVGMHEATISRVTSGKYVETPQGLFELKYFFSSGIGSNQGEATSSRAIKDLIVDLVDQEDPKKPLSDEKIAKMIHSKGYKIARRTVAKYREQMKILPAKLRRETN